MGQGTVGDGLDFCHLSYPQIGLPLVEPIERIVVGAEVLRHPALPSNGAVEHPTECDPIDRSRMDASKLVFHKESTHSLWLFKKSYGIVSERRSVNRQQAQKHGCD
jgi:hypothetical protein